MTKIWEVVVADDLSKAAAAAKFLQEFCPPEADPVWSEKYFRWKLGAQNPAGSGFMTLAAYNGDIVGVTTITKKRLWINGELVIGGEIGDAYTRPDFILHPGRAATLHESTPDQNIYINKSVFGRLVTETVGRAHAAGVSIIYGTPNTKSKAGFLKRLNFTEYTEYSNRNFIRPTSRGVVNKYKALKLFSFILNPAERILATFLSKTSNCGVSLESYNNQGFDLNNLWESSKPEYGFSILQDHKWFNHRFLGNPIANYSVFAIRQHGSFVGIIATRKFNTMNGRPFCYVAGWLIKERDPNILRAAIAQICEKDTLQDLDGFVVWVEDDSVVSYNLKKIGFVASGQSPIIFWDSPEFQSLQLTNLNFSFSLAASDNV